MPWTSDGRGEREAQIKIRREVTRLAESGLRQLRRAVPVDTGRLRAQCRVEPARLGQPTVIHSTVRYARYVAGYKRAIRIARAKVNQQRRPIVVEATFRDQERDETLVRRVRLAPSRLYRVGGGRLQVTLRAASRVSFTIVRGRVRYQVFGL